MPPSQRTMVNNGGGPLEEIEAMVKYSALIKIVFDYVWTGICACINNPIG